MALSADEQRLLDQLEESLRAEDPDLARKLETHSEAPTPRRWAIVIACFIAGLALLIVGMLVDFRISVFGFLVMFAGVAVGMIRPKQAKDPEASNVGEPSDRRQS
ncbi:MAG: DUF3040 domain-containing protein [Propionibacteriaceae bacterium]|nr:DUF3040 domain-containing protein [Propionibacteriaceae bacterium]